MCGAAYNPAQGWKSGSSSALRVGYEAEVIFAHSRLGGKSEDRSVWTGEGCVPGWAERVKARKTEVDRREGKGQATQ